MTTLRDAPPNATKALEDLTIALRAENEAYTVWVGLKDEESAIHRRVTDALNAYNNLTKVREKAYAELMDLMKVTR